MQRTANALSFNRLRGFESHPFRLRFAEADLHQKGHVLATANRLPLELDFYFVVNNKYKAFEF